LHSDGIPDFGIGEPRKIVERNRISGRFLDQELQVDRFAFRSVAEVDRGEYSKSGEVTTSPDFRPLAAMIWSAGNFLPPVILMEAMLELGGELAAGVCARTARAASRIK